MKLYIPRIASLDELSIANTVGCVDWPEKFPYAPQVRFGIGHTGGAIMLRFEVEEQAVRGLATEDNGPVWRDSCVEFFIAPDESGFYYNFEFNCIGTKLLSYRKVREDFVRAPEAIMQTIETFPSLGRGQLPLHEEPTRWSLEAVIPVTALFRHRIADIGGMRARANFYKCGDELPSPHFLSWAPIDNPTPDFHLARFFGEVVFQ